MQYLILLLLFIFCLFEIIKTKKIFTPTFIFNFIWFITLGLYELKLSTLQQDLSNRTILIFLICIISYNITFFLFTHFKIGIGIEKNEKKEESEDSTKKYLEKKESNKVKKYIEKIKSKLPKEMDAKIRIAKWIVIIIFIIEIIYSGGLPLIWKITGDSKNYFDFGITSLNGAWHGLIICLGAYSFFSKSKDKYLYLLIGILILSRQVIMSIIIEAIIFNILDKTKKIDIKKYVIIAIIVFIGFNVLGNIRSGSNEMNNVFKAKEQYTNLPTSIKWVYSYMTFSISNFNNLVEHTNGGVNYGISTLKYIIPNIILEKIGLNETFKEACLVSPNYTVSTYLPPIYLDFGLIGIAIFNIIIAIIGTYLYNKSCSNNSVKNRLLYSVFIHNIIFLFFNNMFLYLPIIIQVVYILLIFNEENKKLN